MKVYFNLFVSIMGGIAAYFLGGLTMAIQALLIFMTVDYITGFMVAFVFQKSPKSDSGEMCIRDSYTYDETWKDIYEDEQQTLSNNILLYDKGGISQADLIKYWNPTFDDKKVEEKKAEINGEKEQKTNRSIEDMLGQ